MFSMNDERWRDLAGGYRTRFDPRPLLRKLETKTDEQATWEALWEELHHQGDVGEASYAAVPHIVRIYCERGLPEWNTYAIVAVIDLARDKHSNPDVPGWVREDYFAAIRSLAERGAHDIWQVKDPEIVRAILSVLALATGARTHARFLLNYSPEELLEIEKLTSDQS
jgi:hypothetical protein